MSNEQSERPEMILFLSDSRGVYIPRDFARSIDRSKVEGLDVETYQALEEGPEGEWYWEAWQAVLDRAEVTDSAGNVYRVDQDGDCWLIPVGMQYDEREGYYWPAPDPDLMVCLDCYQYIANGDRSESMTDGQVQACNELRNAVPGDSRYDEEFARYPCDCCGSSLAGFRGAVNLLEIERDERQGELPL